MVQVVARLPRYSEIGRAGGVKLPAPPRQSPPWMASYPERIAPSVNWAIYGLYGSLYDGSVPMTSSASITKRSRQ